MKHRVAPRVAVLGGGMGGLACAHELARAGLRVSIYEASTVLGGKASSQYLRGTGTAGRRDLPGEHGFRFYPGFYRHVIQSMREVHDPLSPSGTVAGNLVEAPEAGVAMEGCGVVVTPRKPRSVADAIQSIAGIYRVGGSVGDLTRYLGAHVKYLTTCDERQDLELEAQSWARFIGAEQPGGYADEFRDVLFACTRTMVAMDAERGSSRTLGRASCLLLTDSFRGDDVDRTMMGPTSECWLEPWQQQLLRWGVELHLQHSVIRLELSRGKIARAWLRDARGKEAAIEADAFVLAVPLEVAHSLIGPELCEAEPQLAALARMNLNEMTTWMTGVQFFLREDISFCKGHLFLPRSPWSLTAISQAQFWNQGARGMSRYGDGRLRGILSVDVSGCFSPDASGVRLVDERTREGIIQRTLDQLLDALQPKLRGKLANAVFAAHLDQELCVGASGVHNAARLLIHPPGSWRQRPEAVLAIPNLFLASDYVRTSVDLASMEGANEAGRRAARGILSHWGLDPSSVKLFDYEGLRRFARLKALDGWLHDAGLPHLFDLGAQLAAGLRARAGRGARRARAGATSLFAS